MMGQELSFERKVKTAMGSTIRLPRACKYKQETRGCGCTVRRWYDGVVEILGCGIPERQHLSRVRYICPKESCGKEFSTFKELREHRWDHGY